MDELQISGKRFISARRIARENGYTSDYIGQLIRGGKITGQKVGRAWYVDAASFEAYLSGEEVAPAALAVAEEVESAPVVEAVETKEESAEILPTPEEVKEEIAVEEVPVEEEKEEMVEAEEEEEEEIVAAPTSSHAVLKEESVHVPLRLVRTEEKKEVSGLRYVAEDAPSLPEIRSHKKESRIVPQESAFEDMSEVEDINVIAGMPVAAQERGSKKGIAALALVSVALFIFSAVVSSALSLNLSIHEGNSAAATYSLDW